MGGDWNANPRKMIDKHPDCVEVGECRPPHRGGKNTRHWCKGHVGIPHTWEWQQRRSQRELEQRMNLTYNRITEEPVCFGCGKVDSRQRYYCAQCGEPWPSMRFVRAYGDFGPCRGCGAPWMVRHNTRSVQWSPSGSVTR